MNTFTNVKNVVERGSTKLEIMGMAGSNPINLWEMDANPEEIINHLLKYVKMIIKHTIYGSWQNTLLQFQRTRIWRCILQIMWKNGF